MHHRVIPVARISMSSFLYENREALCNTATLLGGEGAAHRVSTIVHGLAHPAILSRQIWRELQWLFDLLTLENVENFERPEAGYFAAVNPDDPVVEEICLLTDEYTDRLSALRAEETTAAPPHLLAA
ncbi:hypothetical protein AB4874_16015 [Thioclava sp. 15-R06ZXC-3]|uniref:Uncharacterized protein n=1 Tax=Thioclava arctica TaxID=3238301 RepID=A0ABV3TPI1_9RHOB